MYGMVNRAVKDLIIQEAGEDTWLEVCAKAGMATTDFSDTTIYDDAVTYDLVAAASSVLGLSAEDILKGFGRHWILFTGKDGWGDLLDMAGDDLASVVAGLDSLHSRVQASMPDCRMPSFSSINHPDGVLEVHYRSEREGLAPMVVGLLEGLAERFDEQWQIEQTSADSPDGVDTFMLTPVSVDASSGDPVGAA